MSTDSRALLDAISRNRHTTLDLQAFGVTSQYTSEEPFERGYLCSDSINENGALQSAVFHKGDKSLHWEISAYGENTASRPLGSGCIEFDSEYTRVIRACCNFDEKGDLNYAFVIDRPTIEKHQQNWLLVGVLTKTTAGDEIHYTQGWCRWLIFEPRFPFHLKVNRFTWLGQYQGYYIEVGAGITDALLNNKFAQHDTVVAHISVYDAHNAALKARIAYTVSQPLSEPYVLEYFIQDDERDVILMCLNKILNKAELQGFPWGCALIILGVKPQEALMLRNTRQFNRNLKEIPHDA